MYQVLGAFFFSMPGMLWKEISCRGRRRVNEPHHVRQYTKLAVWGEVLGCGTLKEVRRSKDGDSRWLLVLVDLGTPGDLR